MKFKVFLFSLMFVGVLHSQQVLDKIVAVVGNEIICKSELDFQTDVIASKRNISPDTPGLRKQVLDGMIDDKLVYAQANLDSITVSDDEVNQRIDYQIEMFKQQYGSLQKVEQIYGMSIEKIKRELKDEVRKQIMVQKLQEKKFGDIQATRRDVNDFFQTYKDSIGVIPEKVDIAHIFRNPQASPKLKEKYKKFAEAILDSIKNGADFAEMAKKYSDDPGSAKDGGDLGWVKRGVFYPEFEAAAFALKPGEISGVVESPVGFHIIQLLERRGESIHCRHILIKIKNDSQADIKTIQFLTDVRDSIMKGDSSFADFAKKYDEDDQSKPFGGDLGTFYISQLDNSLKDVVSKMKVGEISFPKRIEYSKSSYGYHIIYLKKRIPQHKVSLDQDYQELEKLATQNKKQKEYNTWIESLKKKIYWDIKI